MDISDQTEDTTEVDEIEITDLETLAPAEQQQTSGLKRVMLTWQRSLNRRRFRLLTTLIILLLVALLIFANEQSGLAILGSTRNNLTSFLVQHHLLPSNAPPAPLVIKPSAVILPRNDGFVCVMDTTWSPDSKYVVLLGDQQGCATGGSAMPGLLTIHDASTGKRVRSFLLNDLVIQSFHHQYPQLGTEAVFYYHLVLWSHDKHHLAVLFTASFYHEQQSPTFAGVLLLDTNGGTANVLLHPIQNTFLTYIVWDTQSGIGYTAPPTSSGTSQNPGYTIQPSPFYIWDYGEGANKLLPMQDKPGLLSNSSPNATGDPDGGDVFTIWQPGQLGITTGNGNGAYPPGIGTWSTYFAAWSPDGRYIIDNLLIDGRFNIPGRPIPDQQTLVALDMDLLPLLPVRDKGLQRVLQLLASTPAQTNFIGASVSWRFDGEALATYGASDTAYDAGNIHGVVGDIYDTGVDIYRCTDGTRVATLLPSSPSPTALGGAATLRWSDDGLHVLLLNVNLANVMIWNVPHSL